MPTAAGQAAIVVHLHATLTMSNWYRALAKGTLTNTSQRTPGKMALYCTILVLSAGMLEQEQQLNIYSHS